MTATVTPSWPPHSYGTDRNRGNEFFSAGDIPVSPMFRAVANNMTPRPAIRAT